MTRILDCSSSSSISALPAHNAHNAHGAHDARIAQRFGCARSVLASVVFGALALAHIASTASAQPTEYRLDESGNWVQTQSAETGSDGSLLAQARRALAEDRPSEARAILDEWIARNERSTSPLLPEALVLRGDALTALGREFEALYDYEQVVREFPATQSYITAVERELDIGVRYVNGLRRRFLGLRLLPNQDTGEELLIRVQERLPGSRLAERAGIELADHYYNTRQLELAALSYELFIDNYPNSQYAMKARQRRIYSIIGRYKGPNYDGSSLLDSKLLVRRFSSIYPAEAQSAGLDEALVVRLDESAAREMLESGQWYMRRDDDVSARLTFRRLVREHPRTAAAAQAMDLLEKKGWGIEDAQTLARRDRRMKQIEAAELEAKQRAEQQAKDALNKRRGAASTATPPEVKPTDAKPAPTKPVEAKPVETKPVETNPVDAKPSRATNP